MYGTSYLKPSEWEIVVNPEKSQIRERKKKNISLRGQKDVAAKMKQKEFMQIRSQEQVERTRMKLQLLSNEEKMDPSMRLVYKKSLVNAKHLQGKVTSKLFRQFLMERKIAVPDWLPNVPQRKKIMMP